MDEEQEPQERPRPRVIDKRVSSRPESDPAAPTPIAEGVDVPPGEFPSSPPDPEQGSLRREPPQEVDTASVSGSEDRDRRNDPAQGVWTPQQEEEMRAMARHIAETPSLEWVMNTAVTLANVAGTKLDLGATADAQLAIDALAALINGLGPKLEQAETPLRQTLAQLQMAYAEQVAPPPIS